MQKRSSIVGAFVRWLVLLSCIAAGSAYADRNPEWTVLELSPGFSPQSMNNRGDVAGTGFAASTPGCCSRAFLWRNGAVTDISPAGVQSSKAVAVNAQGTVVIDAGGGQIFLARDGTTTKLPFFGVGNDINEGGTVVGALDAGFFTHAFTFHDGVLQDLGTLGGRFSEAFAINNDGVVVGNSRLADNATTHAFVFQDGAMHDIDTLGGASSVAFDVNDHGVVVGGLTDPSFRNTIAFIWDRDRGMRKIVDGPLSVAHAINYRGDVVGTTANGSFLFSDGVLTSLESIPAVKAAGITRFIPEAINDRGWITGTGFKAQGGGAFILIPR